MATATAKPNIQIDDEVRPMTTEEHTAYKAQQAANAKRKPKPKQEWQRVRAHLQNLQPLDYQQRRSPRYESIFSMVCQITIGGL
jgi:dipeptidase